MLCLCAVAASLSKSHGMHSGKPSKVDLKCFARSRNINGSEHRLTADARAAVSTSDTCMPPLPDRRGTYIIYKRRMPRCVLRGPAEVHPDGGTRHLMFLSLPCFGDPKNCLNRMLSGASFSR